MAASKEKVILFANAKEGNRTRQWPVAVFNTEKDARAYAVILRLAYRSSDVAAVRSLDPEVRLTEAGALYKTVNWSLQTLRYAPSPDLGEDSVTEEATS